MDGFNAEILHHIRADALKIQSFPARQRHEERIGLAAIVAFGNVAAEMGVSDLAVQYIIVDETALGLRARREGFLGCCRAAQAAQQQEERQKALHGLRLPWSVQAVFAQPAFDVRGDFIAVHFLEHEVAVAGDADLG